MYNVIMLFLRGEDLDCSLLVSDHVSESRETTGQAELRCIRGVDDAPDRDGKRKERDDLGPVPPSALGDCRIFSPQAPASKALSRLAGFGVLCAIDRPQFAG